MRVQRPDKDTETAQGDGSSLSAGDAQRYPAGVCHRTGLVPDATGFRVLLRCARTTRKRPGFAAARLCPEAFFLALTSLRSRHKGGVMPRERGCRA